VTSGYGRRWTSMWRLTLLGCLAQAAWAFLVLFLLIRYVWPWFASILRANGIKGV
jgi:hypothetical protein